MPRASKASLICIAIMDLIRPIIQFFRDIYQLVFYSEDTPTEIPTNSNTDLELGQTPISELPLCDIIAKLIEFHALGVHTPPNQTSWTAAQEDLIKCARVFQHHYNPSGNLKAMIDLAQAQKAREPQCHDLISFEYLNCPHCHPDCEIDFICLASKNEQSGRRDYMVFGAKSVLLFKILQWNENWFRSYCKLFPKAVLPEFNESQVFSIFQFVDIDLANDLLSRGLDLKANYDVACKAVMLQRNPGPMLN